MYNAMYGPGNCYDRTMDCYANGSDETCSAADKFCADQVENVLDNIANRDEYDVRELSPDPFPPTFYVDYLNSPAVQAALGAYTNFSESSPTVSNAFSSTGDDDRRDDTIADMRGLIAHNLTVVVYAGDADYNCNWLGNQAVVESIDPPGYGGAGFVDIATSDGVVHGQAKQAGAFSFVRVYESGHEVPFYEPLAALQMFERAIGGRDIATGQVSVVPGSTYATVGSKQSTYREGNATIQTTVVGTDATYNTTTNGPNPVNGTDVTKREARTKAMGLWARDVMRSPRAFKPSRKHV